MCNMASFAGEQELLLKNSCSLAHAAQTDSFLHLHYHNHTSLLNQLKIPKKQTSKCLCKISATSSLIIH